MSSADKDDDGLGCLLLMGLLLMFVGIWAAWGAAYAMIVVGATMVWLVLSALMMVVVRSGR